jgi:Rrf2 family protein
MRISSKGRYGLAAMINIAQNYSSGQYITIISIAERLGISKIYLEQVFSLLKRGELVISVKGAQGGYQLSKAPSEISVFEILHACEQMLFDKTESSVAEKAENIEKAMQSMVFDKIDIVISDKLKEVSLNDLVLEAAKFKEPDEFMYFI